MRYPFVLILYLCATMTYAVEWEERQFFKGAAGAQTLRVISSTDTSFFAPIIERFLNTNPALNIEYLVAGSADIYEVFRQASNQSPNQFDVVISSAMDLQFKLVNDGFAYRVEDIVHPDWAQWRQSLFGFTLEPASIVVNKEAFKALPVPQSRQEMIKILREHPDIFRGRLGTYDVRQSGLGYLFATQDTRTSETYWRVMEIMGSLETRLYCCSGAMIEDLAKGTIAIAYNVLGSYAMARNDIADKIQVILPADFPNIMMRTAFIAKDTPRPLAAISFLRYLTSSRWASSRWSDPEEGDFPLPSLRAASNNAQRAIIVLEPGLMVFLDRLKRQAFIKEWENAIIQ